LTYFACPGKVNCGIAWRAPMIPSRAIAMPYLIAFIILFLLGLLVACVVS
jgi:hypothetical protein